MRFPSRRLLRVVSAALGILVLGLLALIILLTILREGDAHTQMMWVVIPLLGLPGLYVLKLISDSWGVLEVDESGIRVRRLLGVREVGWSLIGSVRYREFVQLVQGVESREYLLELLSPERKLLLRLKSTYEREAYAHLIEQAKTRGLRIETGQIQ